MNIPAPIAAPTELINIVDALFTPNQTEMLTSKMTNPILCLVLIISKQKVLR